MWHFSHPQNSEEENQESYEQDDDIDAAHERHTRAIVGDFSEDENNDESEPEGELAVDVFQKDGMVYIQTLIAGIKPDDLEVDIDRDIVTIRGTRSQVIEADEDQYYFKECHWGAFSRSIVLPIEVRAADADATFEDGLLTIAIPRAEKRGAVTIKVAKKK